MLCGMDTAQCSYWNHLIPLIIRIIIPPLLDPLQKPMHVTLHSSWRDIHVISGLVVLLWSAADLTNMRRGWTSRQAGRQTDRGWLDLQTDRNHAAELSRPLGGSRGYNRTNEAAVPCLQMACLP